MNRLPRPLHLVITTLALVSWGSVGHKTIALIAEHHLTIQAKMAVKALIQEQSLADVSNWADQVKGQQEYKATGSWHYLNLPFGLSYVQFEQAVKGQAEPNVYSAINKCIKQIEDDKLSIQERSEALKFIVHLVGDAHQPFHVSRKEDKGGNTIQVQFNDRGTNLHSVWDTKLISYQDMSYEDMAREYDAATPEQIKQWQSDSIMKWLWESYQLSTKLYTEVKPGDKLGNDYYHKHIGIVRQRIEMAGIRLAGLLNKILSHVSSRNMVLAEPIERFKPISLQSIENNYNTEVAVKGKVYGVKKLDNMALIDLGADYPNQLLTVVLKGEALRLYSQLDGKIITVHGTVVKFKSKPEIVVTVPGNVIISNPNLLTPRF